MIISIYHKERWVYLSNEDGSRTTSDKSKAFVFTDKKGELMVEYMKSLGFLTEVVK